MSLRAEATRVMAAGAVLVCSNALGDGAPFFVPVEVLPDTRSAAPGSPHPDSGNLLRRFLARACNDASSPMVISSARPGGAQGRNAR